MTRPLYETKADLALEVGAIDEFCQKHSYDYRKLPIQYRLDYAIFKKNERQMCGMIEVKCRKISWSKYNTLILSLQKVMHMKSYSDFGIRSGILLRNLDGLWLWKFNHNIDRIEWGGRYKGGPSKPRDDQDAEPVVHVPKESFIQVSPVPLPT